MEKAVAERVCAAAAADNDDDNDGGGAAAGWIRLDNLHLQQVVNRGGRGFKKMSRMCGGGV